MKNSIEKAFEQHTNNEFPPKFVFCATPQGEVKSIRLSDVPNLHEKFILTGMTKDNLPILERIGLQSGFY